MRAAVLSHLILKSYKPLRVLISAMKAQLNEYTATVNASLVQNKRYLTVKLQEL